MRSASSHRRPFSLANQSPVSKEHRSPYTLLLSVRSDHYRMSSSSFSYSCPLGETGPVINSQLSRFLLGPSVFYIKQTPIVSLTVLLSDNPQPSNFITSPTTPDIYPPHPQRTSASFRRFINCLVAFRLR